MAKKENRMLFGLECGQCKNQNYVTEKNTLATKDKLELKKYCKKCHKGTPHIEFKLK